jgi:hypothetical protein
MAPVPLRSRSRGTLCDVILFYCHFMPLFQDSLGRLKTWTQMHSLPSRSAKLQFMSYRVTMLLHKSHRWLHRSSNISNIPRCWDESALGTYETSVSMARQTYPQPRDKI